MKKILAALVLAFESTGANAVGYTFDIQQQGTKTNVGLGTLSFFDHLTSEATSNASGRATYNPTPFTITAHITGQPDILWSVGGAFITYNPVVTGPCCAPPSPDAISLVGSDGARFAYGDLSLGGASTALTNGDFTRENFNRLLASLTSASFTIGGPPTYRYGAANFVEVADPVPEPGEWAMIALGLGFVGHTARRRNNR